MFIVFNKQKIYSYLIALSTVVILFVIAFVATNRTENMIQTSVNKIWNFFIGKEYRKKTRYYSINC